MKKEMFCAPNSKIHATHSARVLTLGSCSGFGFLIVVRRTMLVENKAVCVIATEKPETLQELCISNYCVLCRNRNHCSQ